MKRHLAGNQDRRGDSIEEPSPAMGEEGTDHQRYRPWGSFQYLLDLQSARTHGARSIVIPSPGRSYLTRIAEIVVIGKHTCSLQIRFSTNTTVCLFGTPHRSLLTTIV